MADLTLYGITYLDKSTFTFTDRSERDRAVFRNKGSVGWEVTVPEAVAFPEPEVLLPDTPGMYRMPDADQEDAGAYHTDHWAFYYLNESNRWVDMGWGRPDPNDAPHLVLMGRAFSSSDLQQIFLRASGTLSQRWQAIADFINEKVQP